MILRAHAKLLLSGEYLVLAGAEALAIPLKFGQELSLSDGPPNQVTWISKSADETWFTASFMTDGGILEASTPKPAEFVSNLIEAINAIRPNYCKKISGKTITITADFDLSWGVGSSSSLIALMAQLSGIDPLVLHWRVSNGSGYDVVAAVSRGPFFYKQINGHASYTPTTLASAFSNGVYFAYLGKKEDSAVGVNRFLASERKYSPNIVEEISAITHAMASAESVERLCNLMDRHEAIISELLEIKPLKQLRFSDFPGSVKSLGAWGGDFAMFCSSIPTNQVYSYIAAKGLTPVFRFNDIILGYE